MKEQIFLGVIGFSGGLVIAGCVIALMVGLGVITRFIGISHTAKHVRIFEDAILLGSVFGTLMTVYQPTIPLDAAGLAVLGLFSGIFVGGWILALAEIVNLFLCLVKGDFNLLLSQFHQILLHAFKNQISISTGHWNINLKRFAVHSSIDLWLIYKF